MGRESGTVGDEKVARRQGLASGNWGEGPDGEHGEWYDEVAVTR